MISDSILQKTIWENLVPHAPENRIRINVSEGWLAVKGEVEWDYQRSASGSISRIVGGVKYISSLIHLHPRVTKDDLNDDIIKFIKAHQKEASFICLEVQDVKSNSDWRS